MVKIVHIERSGSKVCIELDNEEKAWITGGDLLTSSFTEEQQLEEHDFWKTIYLLVSPGFESGCCNAGKTSVQQKGNRK